MTSTFVPAGISRQPHKHFSCLSTGYFLTIVLFVDPRGSDIDLSRRGRSSLRASLAGILCCWTSSVILRRCLRRGTSFRNSISNLLLAGYINGGTLAWLLLPDNTCVPHTVKIHPRHLGVNTQKAIKLAGLNFHIFALIRPLLGSRCRVCCASDYRPP